MNFSLVLVVIVLVALLSPGTEAQTPRPISPLRVGAAKIDVTPSQNELPKNACPCCYVDSIFRRSPSTNRQRPGPSRNTAVRLVTFNSPTEAPGSYAGVMKTLVSKDALKRITLCACFLSALPIVQGAQPITISMTAEHWQTKENAEFLRQLGFFQGLMRLNSGNAALKGITFNDGTIEFDVNTIGRGMPGIAFRTRASALAAALAPRTAGHILERRARRTGISRLARSVPSG